ncbi:hypothetical protein BVRB_5g098920 [Beta vulgaris subsp. vulgaris]|nr:hypothetical protein BVRB_5g098920 [Beta vulgaris subsp. vulgaris]
MPTAGPTAHGPPLLEARAPTEPAIVQQAPPSDLRAPVEGSSSQLAQDPAPTEPPASLDPAPADLGRGVRAKLPSTRLKDFITSNNFPYDHSLSVERHELEYYMSIYMKLTGNGHVLMYSSKISISISGGSYYRQELSRNMNKSISNILGQRDMLVLALAFSPGT